MRRPVPHRGTSLSSHLKDLAHHSEAKELRAGRGEDKVTAPSGSDSNPKPIEIQSLILVMTLRRYLQSGAWL